MNAIVRLMYQTTGQPYAVTVFIRDPSDLTGENALLVSGDDKAVAVKAMAVLLQRTVT